MKWLNLVCALLIVAPLSAFGDIADSVVEVSVRYQACNNLPGQCSVYNDLGSGVIIGSFNDLPVVATCNHVADKLFQGKALRCAVRIGDQWYGVKGIAYSHRLDLALLQVQMAGLASYEAVEIDEQPKLTSDVEMIGFPLGHFTRVKAKFKATSRIRRGTSQADALITNQPTAEGQSGGGLFAGNKLAGIVFATTNTESLSTSGAELAAMARHYKIKLKAKTRGNAPLFVSGVPPPPEPEIVSPPAGSAGPVGPPGPAGPTGPAGKDGAPGKDVDQSTLSTIEKRLNAIESRVIVVQLIDESGKVVSEQKYAPGVPIKLQFNPVK